MLEQQAYFSHHYSVVLTTNMIMYNPSSNVAIHSFGSLPKIYFQFCTKKEMLKLNIIDKNLHEAYTHNRKLSSC